MKTIKVLGVDDGPWVKRGHFPWLSYLRTLYNVEVSEKPDFLFYSCFGTKFLKYDNCIRIFYTGENVRPDFNHCDYAIGFDRLSFGDRYIRQAAMVTGSPLDPSIDYIQRKFCNFVYSNSWSGTGARQRMEFCKFLAKYKSVDCPGTVLNNMRNAITPREGNFFPGKLEFVKGYKFTIAWENSFYPGYITEKLTQPLEAHSIPIYMGDPDVALDFNPKAFINCNEFKSWDDILDYIVYLDNNDNAYMAMLTEQPMQPDFKKNDVHAFVVNIVENGRIHEKNIRSNLFFQPYSLYTDTLHRIWDKALQHVAKATKIAQAICEDKLFHANIYEIKDFYKNFLDPLLDRIHSGAALPETLAAYFKARSGNQEKAIHRCRVLFSAASRQHEAKSPAYYVLWHDDIILEKIYRHLLKMLWPRDAATLTKIRVGGSGDGGYVQLHGNAPNSNVALSFGVCYHSPWDYEMAQKGYKVLQFDGSIQKAPEDHPNLVFCPKYVVGRRMHAENEITVQEILDTLPGQNDIILQMDVEGSEWEIFESLTAEEMNRFSQIIVEFHKLTVAKDMPRFQAVFDKICSTHVPVHFHYNNDGPIFGFNDFLVSSLWEVSFARKDLDTFTLSDAEYPTNLDYPNVALPDIYIGKFAYITGNLDEAARGASASIPPGLADKFTENGKIPVRYWFLEQRRTKPICIDAPTYEKTIQSVLDRKMKYYGSTIHYLYQALEVFSISGKKILVAGLEACNCDALAIAYGADTVLVTDYNPPVCEHQRVVSMTPEEFAKSGLRPEAAFSISSFEHSGLGRYGDQLDPDADLKAMRELKSKMAPGGILFLAVPVGQDCLVFNAHRIYGPLRLPELLKGWTFLASFGFSANQYGIALGDAGFQPVLVLSEDQHAVNPRPTPHHPKKEILRFWPGILLLTENFISGNILMSYLAKWMLLAIM